MSKRFSSEYGRKIPKPHASQRTWSRWRLFRNIFKAEDQKRELMINETKETIQKSKSSRLPLNLQALLGVK